MAEVCELDTLGAKGVDTTRLVVQRMLRQSHADMTMPYVHKVTRQGTPKHSSSNVFLPNGGTVADAEEPNDEKRVPVRMVRVQ